jgi:hypothetical protein
MHRIWRIIVYLWVLPTTCVGLLFLLPAYVTGGRAQVVDGVLEIHGGVVRYFLRDFVADFLKLFSKRATLSRGGASAMTLGHVVLGQDPECLDWSRSHERVHVRQCERWGPFFLPAYLLASAWVAIRGGRGYLDNPFEREAYGAQG